jgi:hypothetical protein
LKPEPTAKMSGPVLVATEASTVEDSCDELV